jgi:hypothetical protein
MTELTAKKYLESKGLNNHDYMGSGMINHISEMMEEYHQAKLHLLTIPVVSNRRELLIGFKKWHSDWGGKWFSNEHEASIVDEYLKTINCG